MKTSKRAFKNIEYFGECYYRKYLQKWNRKKLKENWWEALTFFFSKSFMRGRRDVLSDEYYYFAIKALGEYFSIDKTSKLKLTEKNLIENIENYNIRPLMEFKRKYKLTRKNCIKHEKFECEVMNKNKLVLKLVTEADTEVMRENQIYNKKLHLGNDLDITMVMDVLNFVVLNGSNIYLWITNELKNNSAKSVYDSLTKLRGIGDKIASFVIRDILLLNENMKTEQFQYAFPIDTWIKKIARKLNCRKENLKEIRDDFLEACNSYKISPLKLNAGLWYMGSSALDIVLNSLDEYNYK